jgi:hypothetical protein
MMQPQHAQRDPDGPLEPGPSPFRAAFSRARVESLAAGALPVHVEAFRVFEYRIERRRGKRKAEVSAWNRLGLDGWELVGVTKKHATFKRERVAQ